MSSQSELLNLLGLKKTSKKSLGKSAYQTWKKATKSKFYDAAKIPSTIMSKLDNQDFEGLVADAKFPEFMQSCREVFTSEFEYLMENKASTTSQKRSAKAKQ